MEKEILPVLFYCLVIVSCIGVAVGSVTDKTRFELSQTASRVFIFGPMALFVLIALVYVLYQVFYAVFSSMQP